MEENTGRVGGLLFADDTTLMAESESNLQRYVSAFVRVCERRKLKINVGKSKVMKMSDTGEKGNLRIKVKEEHMDEVDTFQYLGVDFASNGRMDAELNHRSMEVRKCAGVLKSVMWLWNLRLRSTTTPQVRAFIFPVPVRIWYPCINVALKNNFTFFLVLLV